MKPLQGTLTALITPFRDGKVDLASLETLVQRQLEAGVDGLVPCGTTGEAPTLSTAEQQEIVSCVVRLTRGRVPVLAGAGTNATAGTIELARLSADCGADALLVVTPYYNKPSQEGLFRHFSAVAEASELPIVLYNIPGRCGVEISSETIKRLFEAHENIVAVKHATGSVAGAADLMASCDISVISGDDPVTLPLMSLGAVGVISVLSNLVPQAVKRLTQAVLDKDLATAQAAQRELYPLAKALLSLETNPIPIKTALAMKGLCAEEFRLPLCPMGAEKRGILKALLDSNATSRLCM
ncbi:MAG: 4-hydroxy-tetrahydrodipicolinate synthase [Phycisphaerae bacterium]|nr:4-hydroxy-tetrahydrodipicolinate synthase [Phycisphaerae bacterium]